MILSHLSLFFILRTSFAEKLVQEDVYFALSPTLFKVEPNSVCLIPLLFETVKVTGNLHTVWRGLTLVVYLHCTDVFQTTFAHLQAYLEACVFMLCIHIVLYVYFLLFELQSFVTNKTMWYLYCTYA